MEPIFEVDGVNFSHLVEAGGIKWSRNDLDREQSGRNLDGSMQRSRVCIKRKLSISCMNMDTAQLMALNAALLPIFIRVRFLDAIDGIVTRVFYGSTVEATTQVCCGGVTYWTGATFSLIER